MIDASYSARVPASDPSAYSGASSATSKAGQGDRGFYETLANVGQNNQKSGSSDGETAASADDAASEQVADDGADTADTKSLVDTRQRPAQSADRVRSTGNLWEKADKSAGKTADEAKADAGNAARTVKPTAADDDAAAQVTTSGLVKVVTEGKQGLVSGKTDKTKAEDAEQDADTAESAATALDDVLNLLSSDLATAGAHVAPEAGAATGELHLKAAGRTAGAKAEGATSTLATNADAGLLAEASGETPVAGADTDRNVRFVRADGKAMTMRTGQGRADDGADAVDNSARQATATIEVVDARRFLAPTASSNSSNVLATMVGNSEWASAMRPGSELSNAATQTSTGNVVNTLKIKMHPIDLGSVTATLRLNGEVLTVELTVENSAAYRQLSDDQSDMVSALRAQGYAVDQIQVSMSSVSRAPTDGSQDPAAQQQSQQQMQQSGGQASGNGGNQRQDAAPASFSGTGTAGVTVDEAAAAKASGDGGTRPDHVYI